jgi:soluble cytochrome b562
MQMETNTGPVSASPKKMRALPTIAAELEKATAALSSAQDKARQAKRGETDAANKVNDLQNEFDEAVESLRDKAPTDTSWERERRQRDIARGLGRGA